MLLKNFKFFIFIYALLTVFQPIKAEQVHDLDVINYNVAGIIPAIDFKEDINLKKFRKYNISDSYRDGKRVPNIVIHDNILYVLNDELKLILIDLDRNKEIKRYSFIKDKNLSCAGISYNDGYLYIALSNGQLVVFSLISNGIFWEQTVPTPINSVPLVYDDKIFLVSHNTVYALNKNTGDILWKYIASKSGISFRIGYIPTIFADQLIVGLSSSDVIGLRLAQGNITYKINMESISKIIKVKVNPLIGDIKASVIPVNHNFLVFSNDKMALVDFNTQKKIWSINNYGSYNTPILYNNTFFTIDIYGNLMNANIKDGHINWKKSLVSSLENKKRVFWFGPRLVNGDLIVNNTIGDVLIVSTKDGTTKKNQRLFTYQKEKLYTPINITSNTMAVLSNMGNLYIYGK